MGSAGSDICGLEAPKYLGSQRVDGLHPGASSCTLRGVSRGPHGRPRRGWFRSRREMRKLTNEFDVITGIIVRAEAVSCVLPSREYPGRLHAQAGSLE